MTRTDSCLPTTCALCLCTLNEDPRDPAILSRLNWNGWLLLHDDKTFDLYSDLTRRWRPRYVIPTSKLVDKPSLVSEARYFRMAYRRITGGTNYRTCIVNLLSPGCLFGHTVFSDRRGSDHPSVYALALLGVMASHTFDWSCRLKTATDLSLFIINECPFPTLDSRLRFVAHNSLRLTCNHAGYGPLWRNSWVTNGAS